jgi:integrase
MRGFIRQRGSAWELMVYLGQDAITGKKRYTTRTVRGSRREADRVLARMVADADQGGFARTSATVGDLLEHWFAQARDDYSPKTVLETRSYLDRDLLPALGQVPLSKLRPEDLDRFYRGLRAHGSRGRPLAPGSVRRIHGILRRALQQGVRWGWIAINPAASASPPKVPKTDVKPPTPADLGRLLRWATVDDVDLATFVTLSAATGARRSELLALRWDDLDLVRGVVTISRGIVNGPDGLVEKDTKTHQARRVTLDSATVAVLAAHRERAAHRARLAQVELSPGALLFSRDGLGEEPWYPDSITRRFHRLCERAGLEGVRLHDLRHYVATQLLAAGVDVRTVAGRLGHRNAATTLNVYSHFLPEADRRAADVLADLLGAAADDA